MHALECTLHKCHSWNLDGHWSLVWLVPICVSPVSHCDAFVVFFSSRRRHTRFDCDWSSDVCSSDLFEGWQAAARALLREGVAPGEVGWREASPGEAPTDRAHEAPTPGATRVPRQFLDLDRKSVV